MKRSSTYMSELGSPCWRLFSWSDEVELGGVDPDFDAVDLDEIEELNINLLEE